MQRTNHQWLTALGASDPDVDAVADLVRYLERGMARALADKRLSGADLEDFAQEGALRVISRLDSFRNESRFTTWAMSVALRIAFSELRRARWKDVSIEDLEIPPSVASDPDDTQSRLESRELLNALRSAIDSVLTDRQRTVILAELAGMPGVVVADRLGVKPNAIYKMYHDARKKLRTELCDIGFCDEEVRALLAAVPQGE